MSVKKIFARYLFLLVKRNGKLVNHGNLGVNFKLYIKQIQITPYFKLGKNVSESAVTRNVFSLEMYVASIRSGGGGEGDDSWPRRYLLPARGADSRREGISSSLLQTLPW